MSLTNLFKRRRESDKVTFDESRVVRTRPDGVSESIAWDDLAEVGILTTDRGPAEEDFFFILISRDGRSGCAIPQGAEGADKLLARLQLLPGFDHRQVVVASGSADNNRFTCWKRPG